MPDCRWSIKDVIKVFVAYGILMFAGMPVVAQVFRAIFGYTVLSVSASRSMALFITIFINGTICLYILYIVCAVHRQQVAALGLSLTNLSNNIKWGMKRYFLTIPVIMLAGFIINMVANYYGIVPEMQDVVRWILEEKSVFVLFSLIFLGIIVAPVIEEIMFRGFLQPALKNVLGRKYAIIASASVFAAVHMDVYAFLQIFILGVLLGYLYERTQTLAASIVAHILHNSLTLIFLLYFKFFLKGKVPIF
jgi:membrane protease YdiL (CAAX protease family)